MPAILYKYLITYADGRKRRCKECFTGHLDVSEDEYLRVVEGIASGHDLIYMDGIDDLREKMFENVRWLDSWSNMNGSLREKPLQKPREIVDIIVFMDPREVESIRSIPDPVTEMKRPEQNMTVYRSDGSHVDITYKHGWISYVDSRKTGSVCSMTADTFISWVVH